MVAGSSSDTVARVIAEKLRPVLGETVIVDNRAGGDSVIGARYVAQSAPDGYTFLVVGGATFNSALKKELPFELFKDLLPVAGILKGGYMFIAGSALPIRNMNDLVSYARANPGRLTIGSPGPSGQLAIGSLQSIAGVQVIHVPYKGSGQTALALLSGEVAVVVDSPLPHKANIEAGKLFPLAIATRERSGSFASVPTTDEAGFPDLQMPFHSGVWAPAGTPAAVIGRMNAAVNKVLADPEVVAAIGRTGGLPMAVSPDQFRQAIQEEMDIIRRAAKAANYQPD